MDFTNFLLENDVWWRFIHVAGVIIALGSVVFADLLLLSLKIKPSQASLVAKISPLLSLQVWIGLFFAVLFWPSIVFTKSWFGGLFSFSA